MQNTLTLNYVYEKKLSRRVVSGNVTAQTLFCYVGLGKAFDIGHV